MHRDFRHLRRVLAEIIDGDARLERRRFDRFENIESPDGRRGAGKPLQHAARPVRHQGRRPAGRVKAGLVPSRLIKPRVIIFPAINRR